MLIDGPYCTRGDGPTPCSEFTTKHDTALAFRRATGKEVLAMVMSILFGSFINV